MRYCVHLGLGIDRPGRIIQTTERQGTRTSEVHKAGGAAKCLELFLTP